MIKLKVKKVGKFAHMLLFTFVFTNYVSDAQYTIIRGNKEIVTNDTNAVDSYLNNPKIPIQSSCTLPKNNQIFYEPFGQIMWVGTNIKKSEDGKINIASTVMCFENGYICKETHINTATKKEDYCNIKNCIDSDCNSLWNQDLKVRVQNNNSLIFKSSSDIFVEIYKAYNLLDDSYINRYFIKGDNNDYAYNFNMENDVAYIVVFKNIENDVISVQKVGR
jgi:hypothetical protein